MRRIAVLDADDAVTSLARRPRVGRSTRVRGAIAHWSEFGGEDPVLTGERALVRTDLDAVALKPAECDVSRAGKLAVDAVLVDYEGHEHVPGRETLRELADATDLRLTTPVRADGFDPLGDRRVLESLPDDVGRALVAGHPAYLTAAERERAIAPRLGAARRRDPDAWVGTEGIERLALAAGGTQYELLSASTAAKLRALRAAGFEGEVAVYAPTVLTDDEDELLDAVGSYVARRESVARALPSDPATDASANGRTREELLAAAEEYALAGPPADVRQRVHELRAAGATSVVGYPARGLHPILD